MGRAAILALVDELRGKPFVQPIFDTELVVRASTAPPRHATGAPRGEEGGPAIVRAVGNGLLSAAPSRHQWGLFEEVARTERRVRALH